MTGMTGLEAYLVIGGRSPRREGSYRTLQKQSLRQCKSNDNDGIVADTDVANDDVELQDDDVEDDVEADEDEGDHAEDDVEDDKVEDDDAKKHMRMIM